MKTASPALVSLLANSNEFVMWGVFTFTLIDGSVISWTDGDVSGYAGSLSDAALTTQTWAVSAVYPQSTTDTFTAAATIAKGNLSVPPIDTFAPTATIASGTLTNSLRSYSNGVAETFNASASFTSGALATVLRSYSNGVAETFNVSAALTSGTLVTTLLTYNIPAETFNASATFTGGTLA